MVLLMLLKRGPVCEVLADTAGLQFVTSESPTVEDEVAFEVL